MGGGGIWAKYVNDFKARVIADGGTMESPSCAKSDVKFLVQNPEPPAPSAFDSDYQAILDQASSLGYAAPSAAQQTLQNTLVTDLKTAGVWDKLDVFYVFATDGDSDYATLNWKAPSSHQVTKVSSPTFTADEGFQGNGTSSYLDTNFDIADASQFTQNNAMFGMYVHTINTSSSGYSMGLDSGLTNRYRILGNSLQRINTSGSITRPFNGTTGLQAIQRTSSTIVNFIDNSGAVSSNISSNSTAPPTDSNFVLFRYNGGGYADSKISISFIGESLDSTESSDFYDSLNTYISAL